MSEIKHEDTLNLLLDDLAAVAKYWEKRRDQGLTPFAIRGALLLMIDEINEGRKDGPKE